MAHHSENKPATLREVAAAAGVNPSTVSRAMRGDPRLRPETRERIKALARQMNYRPNPFLTAFTTQVRNRRVTSGQAAIAIIDTYSQPWSAEYQAGICSRAADHGFSVDTLRTRELAGGVEEAARIIRARGIRGAVILPVENQTTMNGFDFRPLASATIDLSLRSHPLHRASPDYFQGMQLAIDTLHSRRCKRIGFCTDRSEINRIGQRWLGGYLAWHAQGDPGEFVKPHISRTGDIQFDGPHRKMADAHWRACRDDFEKWLDSERPDAIISNDNYFETWLHELGRRVPGDTAFASLGLNQSMKHSGVDQRGEHIGAAAMDLVASQLYRNEYGLPFIPTTILVPSIWIDGTTTF